jgi:hypothetical protein
MELSSSLRHVFRRPGPLFSVPAEALDPKRALGLQATSVRLAQYRRRIVGVAAGFHVEAPMHMHRRAGFLGGVSVAASLLAIPAPAATFVVADFGDSGAPGQLRSLINAAAPGDTILVPPATIVLTGAPGDNANASGDLDILKDLTIVGAGPELTVIDAGGVDRVFQIQTGLTVTISGLTLRKGNVDPAAPADPSGGGLLNRGALTTLVDVVVEDNFAGGGGGIANFAGTLALSGCTVRDNSSTGITANGGGISNFAKLEITHSTISGNVVFGMSASTVGGGVINVGVLTMRDSSVVGNDASGNLGGGLYQTPFAGPMALVNVTIVDNRVGTGNGFGFGGGLANASAASVTIVNTLIARNQTGPSGSGPDCSGTITSLGHNLVESTAGCTLAPAAGDILGLAAGLQVFGDHGGPTETYSLRRRSRAVDAGDGTACGLSDQRGVRRHATCDIGSFEVVP